MPTSENNTTQSLLLLSIVLLFQQRHLQQDSTPADLFSWREPDQEEYEDEK